jgi:hypothetical protein
VEAMYHTWDRRKIQNSCQYRDSKAREQLEDIAVDGMTVLERSFGMIEWCGAVSFGSEKEPVVVYCEGCNKHSGSTISWVT